MTGSRGAGATLTTCPYCGVGCGVTVRSAPVPGEPVIVSGDPAHPANLGRLCSKGAALAETLGLETRLLEPSIGGRNTSWGEALDHVARGFLDAIESHGPEAVAFYVSGQLLTEDYYVANKLMKGFIGSANIDTNSRLCMASAVAAHTRAFGADTVPGNYEDLELADLVVIAGSNLAWAHPVLFQRLQAARERRPEMRVVVIDPRRTATAGAADLHLALAPGTDAWLFNGLLHHLHRDDRLDLQFLEDHTEGFAATLRAARESSGSVPRTAAACGLPEQDVATFFQWFARTERAVTLFSQGINQSDSGVDKANAILNLHLATGRIGRPGQGPLSLTGQPNAMGGREVGGLANQLAAHMGFDDPEHLDRLRRFWQAPSLATRPGLKAVELFEGIEAGRVKAVWIMGTNPAFSLPEAERFSAALRRCPFVVVSDCVADTETTRLADVLLPAAAWGEKEGTVTNSERCISRQRAFLPPAGLARPDWWIICEVARRLGFGAGFPYAGPAEIFREHARLSGFENGRTRAFDIGGLSGLSDAGYDALAPLQWPVPARDRAGEGGSPVLAPGLAPGAEWSDPAPDVDPAGHAGSARLYADARYFTAGGRARLVPVQPRGPAPAVDGRFPLRLITGRTRDQWHSMTRTALTSRLTTHRPEPFVEIHPEDALPLGLTNGQIAAVHGPSGRMLARVRLTPDQAPGSVFVPMHWSSPFARESRVNVLIPVLTDPISGQPAFKAAPVRLQRLDAAWHGFLLSRTPLPVPDVTYRTVMRGDNHFRYELAGEDGPQDWAAWMRALCGDGGEWLEFADVGRGVFRAARLDDDRLTAVLLIGPDAGGLPERDALGGLFALKSISAPLRLGLLSGRPAAAGRSAGRTLCACLGIGEGRIRQAIREGGLVSIEAVGERLGAGTGCGSCIPELQALLAKEVGEPSRRLLQRSPVP
jgi:assimilatory nitrate reductase catalytic subunit